MKYIFLLFFALVIAATARAGQPWVFGAGEAVNLTNGTAFKNGVKNIAGALDPSAVAVSAPSGSMYFSTSGTIYVKQDAGLTTNWLPLGIATTGSLTTLNGQSGPNVNIATGSSGTDFNIAASSNTITLNLPSASGSNRGLLTSADYAAFLAKQDAITGAASTVVTSNLTANRAVISNGSGKIAASAVTDTELGYVGGVTSAIQTQLDGKEPTITGTTSADYYRGDKTFQPLNKAAVGLSNVDNTSDANKPVSTATQTALDLKVDGAASSVDSEVMLYSGTTGKVSKRATGSGYAKLTSGVLSTSANVPASDLSGQVALANGGTNKNMTAVNGGVVYTDADSQEVTAAGISGQVLESNGAAAPSFKTKTFPVKADAGLVVNAQRLIVPNKQLTNVTGSDYYVESGNKNILDDPSYEGANQTGAWTLDYGTFISDNSPIDGSYNAELSLSAQALDFYQYSTLYASQFADGVQGLAMIRARTSITSTPIYFCPAVAGAIPTSLTSGCVQIQTNGKWGLYKVPFILGGTSNGVRITSNSINVTGSVELDDAFVGAVDLKQDVDQSKIAGESYFAGTTNCLWSRTSTTVGAFTTDSDCVGPTIVDSSMGSWQTTDADLPRQTINNLPAGKYRATFYFPNSNGSSGQFSAFSINDGTTTCEAISGGSATTLDSMSVSCVFNYTSSGNRVFEVYSAAASGSININNGSATPRASVKFQLEYFGNSQIYSAQNANYGPATYTPTVGSASGTLTNYTATATHQRNGNLLTVKGIITFTGSAGTWGAPSIGLPSGLSPVANTSVFSVGGAAFRDASAVQNFEGMAVLQGSTVYLISPAFASVTQAAPFAWTTSDTMEFNFTVAISGWDNTNSTISTFNEVPVDTGIAKPKICRYAFGGASATLASPVNCSTGTCVEVADTCGAISPPTFSSTGVYINTTIANGTFANSTLLDCKCQAYDTSFTSKECDLFPDTGDQSWATNSSGGAVLNIQTTTLTGSAGNAYVIMKCEGQAP